MSKVKSPKTFQEQVHILKSRGCIIKDDDFCIEKLKSINYYRISAYFLPFKQENDFYQEGITFEQIYKIYEFDRRIRNLLFSAIEVIEISLKTQLAYYHGHKYGPLGYYDSDNFNERQKSDIFRKKIERIIKNNKNLLFVKHHQDKYDGSFPIWVIIELFSFGMLSYFYSDLHIEDQKAIAKIYGVHFSDMRSWLRCLTDLRNICAHYGRLYYRKFSALPKGLALPQSIKRLLWGVILVLKIIYPSKNKWNKEIVPVLEALIIEYKEYISLKHIGFPNDWLTQIKK